MRPATTVFSCIASQDSVPAVACYCSRCFCSGILTHVRHPRRYETVHRADFVLLEGNGTIVGVKTGGHADGEVWGYWAVTGQRVRSEVWSAWTGMEAMVAGDTVGLVLDLVADTLSVYRNERRLGVLWTGIAGKQLSWFASVNVGSSVRVSKGIPPPGWYGLGVLAKVKNARTARTHACMHAGGDIHNAASLPAACLATLTTCCCLLLPGRCGWRPHARLA